jgi:hypothetical protein
MVAPSGTGVNAVVKLKPLLAAAIAVGLSRMPVGVTEWLAGDPLPVAFVGMAEPAQSRTEDVIIDADTAVIAGINQRGREGIFRIVGNGAKIAAAIDGVGVGFVPSETIGDINGFIPMSRSGKKTTAADEVKTLSADRSVSKAMNAFKMPRIKTRDLFRCWNLSSCIPVDFQQGTSNH